MSKESFDFSEALKRMRQGKKVGRKNERGIFITLYIEKDKLGKETIIGSNKVYAEPYPVSHLNIDKFILATDWEEVEE
nr:MAG TPA: Protein of unknown function (DUF2829) [Bacteriophage sp.]